MLKHIIFDLDETLYPRNAGLMQAIGARIRLYMIERMDFSSEEAEARRARYFRLYGTSLRGLMIEEVVDREDYLAYVHDLDLTAYIGPNPALAAMLRRIPLVKSVFTNATEEHARRVLSILGVADQFSEIFDIRATDFLNKPDPQAYQRILTALDAHPRECVLVEDSPRNLHPARALGMWTVLVDHADCDEVDYCIDDILKADQVVARILSSVHAS